jgi:hypothetical protein
MPDEIAEMRDRYLTAIANSVAAQDAADAADAEAQAASDLAASAREASIQLQDAETSALLAYRAALRANGYVDTASGPRPADAPGMHRAYGSALPHRREDCSVSRCGLPNSHELDALL